jgi:hypothetical protein
MHDGEIIGEELPNGTAPLQNNAAVGAPVTA